MDNSLVLTSRENLPENNDEAVKQVESRKLVSEGKVFAAEGQLHKSLKCFQQAQKLFPSDKILAKIKKIEEVIAEDEGEEEDDFGYIQLDNDLVIFKKLVQKLYPHQIDGIKWFYNLYKNKKQGGILADDMGLGKTIQVISFLSAMFDMNAIKTVLLVLPLSLIPNWTAEFDKWAPGIRTECYHGALSKRRHILQSCQRNKSVCITTYGLIVTAWEALGHRLDKREHVWDYIILDEGHRIKNPTKTTKGLHKIPSKNRLILTGTPVQNKVRDLWALMDWVLQGSLLGSQKTFRSDYEIPIERARQRDASAGEIHLGNSMAESLRKLTDPFILRRTKDMLNSQVLAAKKANKGTVDSNQDKSVLQKQPTFPKLSTKNDFVIWVYLSKIQQKIYQDFIEMDSVKDLLASKRSPLIYLTIIKKICDHPRLLSTKACMELGLRFSSDTSFDNLNSSAIEDCAANRIDNVSDETLMEESGKLQFLVQLMLKLREEGHRTLIFSMSRKMLNIIQRILLNRRFKIMRLDGKVTKLAEREKRVRKFQEDSSYEVFLLTTQVGGVGLTLTAADRVIIYDPSWNPATDAQAVDRIYRIGQKKSVAVYRLITCGTVEEKIYRRQIFKSSVIQQSVGGSKDPYRYFTSQDLKELFILGNVESSDTQKQLEELHGSQRNLEEKLQQHIKDIHQLNMWGISDHDLMFSRKADDFDYENEMTQNYDNMVEQAQDKLKLESDQLTEAEQRWGAFNETKPKFENENKFDNEPVYPIEGLTDKIALLQLPSFGITKDTWDENSPLQSPKKLDNSFPIEINDSNDDKTTSNNQALSNDHLNISDNEEMFSNSTLAAAPQSSFFNKKQKSNQSRIIAEDSPITLTKNKSLPDLDVIEVEESFDLFEENLEESSDNESLDGDGGWKSAFSEPVVHDTSDQPVVDESASSSSRVHDLANISAPFNQSTNKRLSDISAISENSPMFASKRHKRQIIESDDEAQEDNDAINDGNSDVSDVSDDFNDGISIDESDGTDNDEHDVTNYESDFINDEPESSVTEDASDIDVNPDDFDFNFVGSRDENTTGSNQTEPEVVSNQVAEGNNLKETNNLGDDATASDVGSFNNDDDTRTSDDVAEVRGDVIAPDLESNYIEDHSILDGFAYHANDVSDDGSINSKHGDVNDDVTFNNDDVTKTSDGVAEVRGNITTPDLESNYIEDPSTLDLFAYHANDVSDDGNINSEHGDVDDDVTEPAVESDTSFSQLVFNLDGSISNDVSYVGNDVTNDNENDVTGDLNNSEDDNGLGNLILDGSDVSLEF